MGAPENNEIVFASEELTSFFLHEKQRSNNSAISLSSFIMFKKKMDMPFSLYQPEISSDTLRVTILR